MPRIAKAFPPDLVEEARRLHARGAPQRVLAGVLGTTQGTVQRRLKDWGWGPAKPGPLGPHQPKFSFLPAPRDIEEADAEAADAAGLAGRMRRLASRELRRLEVCGGTGEEVVRALDALARVLKTAQALSPERAGPEAPGGAAERYTPEEIEQMRADIAKRLDQIVEEEGWRYRYPAEEAPEEDVRTEPRLREM